MMQITSRFVALVALGAATTLAACGGSTDLTSSPATPASGDDALVTSSGRGPGGPASPTPGTGSCTQDCDGTGQGPGPGAGNGGGYGPGDGSGNGGNGPGHGAGYGPGPRDGLCGNACTGPVGPDPADVATVLGLALQEEYRAQNLYLSVLEDHPAAVPFATIVESETRHVEALQALFARRQMPAPPSSWTPASFPPYSSLPLACAAGVLAETADAAFYTPYLIRTDLPQDVRNVFTNLQAASLESHLPAFERCN
jgi:hypothetical protein